MMALMLFAGCAPTDKTDAILFKEEYEALNGKENKNGIDYVNVQIPSDNPMVYASADEIVDLLDKDAVIYFGFDECPWCRNALPVLIEAAKELKVEKIYYYDLQEERDVLKLNDDGTITTERKMSEGYHKIYEALYDHLSVYEGLNDETIKRLYAPTVVFVKNGEVIGMHESTVESQNDPSVEMSASQKQELKDIYKQGISKVNSNICDVKC